MKETKNEKSKVWIYAVVLFTSAFIVLLLTAYSQIKLNNNLSNYKDKFFSTESEKNKFQLNFTSAQETNNKLNEEIEKLKAEKKDITEKYDHSVKEKTQSDENNKKTLQEYDKLSSAQVLYLNEKYVDAALILTKEIDISLLDDKAKELYAVMLEKTIIMAGNELYQQGYEFYKKKDFASAIQKFSQALEISASDKSSDSWLYYLALSENKSGKVEKAVEHMGSLVSKYPDSTYFKRAKYFYEQHSK